MQPEIVLADIAQQVDAGANHISFGDPDFFNGPGHSLKIVRALHERYPQLTYDVTIKIEHLLKYSAHLEDLKETGCLWVTSAVESIDDRVLKLLDKGHTKEDFLKVLERFREIGLNLSPTFVPFTPWTTREGYLELLQLLAEENLDRTGCSDSVGHSSSDSFRIQAARIAGDSTSHSRLRRGLSLSSVGSRRFQPG